MRDDDVRDRVSVIVVVMGIAGSGKTTIGRALATRLGARFLEGDDLHPAANVAKMARGEPLDDADRAPWLASIARAIDAAISRNETLVVACSALKEKYRDVLRRPEVRFVYLRLSREEALRRVASRSGHFFPAKLVDSQIETLEEPADAIVVDAAEAPEEVVGSVVSRLAAPSP